MKKWMIKTKRDWAIAAGFLILLSYLITFRYRQPMNEWLMNFSPEKMSYFNQPENHGVYLLTVILAAVLGTVLWIWQRKMSEKSLKKGLLIIWGAAFLALAAIWAAYQAECRQIVDTPYAGLTPDVSISSWHTDLPDSLELTKEEQQELLELCLNLKPLPEEEQKAMMEALTQEEGVEIFIQYPEYKNHSYHLWFHLEGEILCLYRGHSKSEAVYYDGTGARALVEEILTARGSGLE